MLDDDEDSTTETVDRSGIVDAPGADLAVVGHAKPPPIERFHRSAVGTALAAGMFGLRDVLEPRKDETPAIVEDWAGGEPFSDRIVLRLDPDHPEDSIVMVRRRSAPDSGEGGVSPAP